MSAPSVGERGTWVIDLDGVIWLAGEPITGARRAIARLRASGRSVLFASNNSSPTVDELRRQLSRVGIEAPPEEIATSAQAAAAMIEPGARALVVAGAGAIEALEARGVEPVSAARAVAATPSLHSSRDARSPRSSRSSRSSRSIDRSATGFDVVVVGWTRGFDFASLGLAMRAVRAGARLIGTNEDPTYPTPEGLLPGAGSLLAAVAAASQKVPEIAGKPHEPFARLVRGHGPVGLVIGDRPSTDGELARALHAPFALVTSGVTAPGAPLPTPTPALVEDDIDSVVRRVLGETSEYR